MIQSRLFLLRDNNFTLRIFRLKTLQDVFIREMLHTAWKVKKKKSIIGAFKTENSSFKL